MARIHRVVAMLDAPSLPNCNQSESDYDKLCLDFDGPPEYGYDGKSTWLRGLNRAKQIVDLIPNIAIDSLVLEIGCGDGMASVQLAMLGLNTCLTDLRDWRDPRAAGLPFVAFDLAQPGELPGEGLQDLIFSYNAFEHFPDPKSVMTRIMAKVRPGGFLFFEFGPLYSGPWGLHAYRMLSMPFPQFLFRESFWREKIKASGVQDLGQELADLQPLNKWTIAQFDNLWISSGCKVIKNLRYGAVDHLDLVLQYPNAFQGRGLKLEDLTTQGVMVLLQKPPV